MTALFCQSELKTRELLNADREKAEWSSKGQIIRMVFRAMYASALPRERIVSVGCALGGIEYLPSDMPEVLDQYRKELRRMVKAGVLRSRRAQGETLYEVNY